MTADAEIKTGSRFEFGANWSHFLALLDETADCRRGRNLFVKCSVSRSLRAGDFWTSAAVPDLFSLAARRLGAQVHSFDFDPQSVACTQELKRRFFPEDSQWRVEQGLGARQRISRGPRPIRHRLQLGSAASHRIDVGGHRERDRTRRGSATARCSSRFTTIRAGSRTPGGSSKLLQSAAPTTQGDLSSWACRCSRTRWSSSSIRSN